MLTGNSCQKFIVSAVSRNTVSDFEIQHQLDCHGRSFLNLFGLFLEISISDLFSKRLYRKVLSQGKNKALKGLNFPSSDETSSPCELIKWLPVPLVGAEHWCKCFWRRKRASCSFTKAIKHWDFHRFIMVKASLQQYTKFLFGCYLNRISVRCFQLYNNFKVFTDYNYHQLGVYGLT